MPSIVPPPGGRLVFALNREKFSFVVGVFFFFFFFWFSCFSFPLKCVPIFIMYRKRVCGYLVCFKSIKKLALGRQAGEGPILPPTPAMWCTPCLKIFKKFFFSFLENPMKVYKPSCSLGNFLSLLLTRVMTGALLKFICNVIFFLFVGRGW